VGYTFGVGREAPSFTLASSDGGSVTLKSFRGDWLPILIFFRPDHPDTSKRLAALSAAADQFWGLRGQLLALAAATADELGRLAGEVPTLAFPLLVDEGARIARAYGAYNRTRGAVSAAAYVVDRAGKIVWVGEGEDAYRSATLLAALENIAR
jgi:thioredoxin-dependent peroxiredoxin